MHLLVSDRLAAIIEAITIKNKENLILLKITNIKA
jgi:hypothetical protein